MPAIPIREVRGEDRVDPRAQVLRRAGRAGRGGEGGEIEAPVPAQPSIDPEAAPAGFQAVKRFIFDLAVRAEAEEPRAAAETIAGADLQARRARLIEEEATPVALRAVAPEIGP
ncbi:MAG: hypothetical protein FD129_3174, partial [bacterium]